jgi:hypothetical protein
MLNKIMNLNYKTYSHWGITKHRVPQGWIPCPLLFLTYINNLPATINLQSKPILSANNTRIISHPETNYFQNCTNVFATLNKLFNANNLTLNFYKMNVITFCTNSKTCINIDIGFDKKMTKEAETTELLCLQIDSNLNWKENIINMLSLRITGFWTLSIIWYFKN